LITDSGLHHIDQEWTYDRTFSLGTVALRYLTQYSSEPAAAKLFGVPDKHPGKQVETIRRVILNIGLMPNEHSYEEYISVVNEINKIVYPHKLEHTNVLLSIALAAPDTDVSSHINNSHVDQKHLQVSEKLKNFLIGVNKYFRRHICWRFK
jgi:hypothetical protein